MILETLIEMLCDKWDLSTFDPGKNVDKEDRLKKFASFELYDSDKFDVMEEEIDEFIWDIINKFGLNSKKDKIFEEIKSKYHLTSGLTLQEIADTLIKYNKYKGQKKINLCDIIDNDIEEIKKAVEAGANINARSDKNDDHETALMCAVKKNKIETVKFLIEKGANIEMGNFCGQTCLMFASENGYIELVKYLIEKGANINRKDNNQKTALMYASEHGHIEAVRVLLDNGADINSRDIYKNKTALGFSNDENVIKLLKSSGGTI